MKKKKRKKKKEKKKRNINAQQTLSRLVSGSLLVGHVRPASVMVEPDWGKAITLLWVKPEWGETHSCWEACWAGGSPEISSAQLTVPSHTNKKKKKLSETKTIMNCELRNTNPNVMYLCYFLTYCYFHLIIYSSYATPYCSDTLSLRQSPRSSGSLVEP